MADMNDIHMMLGRLLEGQENVERGIQGINHRIDNNIQPILEDYKSTKSRIVGYCLGVSASAGGAVAWVTGLFKGHGNA